MKLFPGVLMVLSLISGAVHSQETVFPAISQSFEIRPGDLPPPGTSRSVANPPRMMPRAGRVPTVPDGFEAILFAGGLSHARWLERAANGDVFLAEPRAGKITLLRDGDGDGTAEHRFTFVDKLDRPHGMAIQDGFFYVADLAGVWRVPYQPGDTQARERLQAVTAEGALGSPGGHWTRNLAFHPDGTRFYVAIGSRGNIAVEDDPRATIREFVLDAKGWAGSGQTYASGLRNPVGIAFRPGTPELWAVVNERDGMGDDLVPDYLAKIERGQHYGWPYYYIGAHLQPGYDDAPGLPDPDSIALPEVLFRSHSAPLGLAFWGDDAFVALHGSWNAGEPRGYAVVRVPMTDGKPTGTYEVFASGFRTDRGDRAEVWGRPVGLAAVPEGGVLVADDGSQSVWLIRPKAENRPKAESAP